MDRLLFCLVGVQLVFSAIAAVYFYRNIRGKGPVKPIPSIESKKELEKLKNLRNISLTKPLSEQIRPKCLSAIVGQEQGIKALRAALCGPNPQHVILYGPPGVGKTAAARLILEEAKKISTSPFGNHSKFIELDATTLRFDERSIADPLIGSVHDPIYQGAGAYGAAGIPQPKPGAVTQAHGGVLFLDEIGEMHPIQMNKLLKVLEDRVAHFQSSYYSESNQNIPMYIHEIFKNGLPADFRLIGATTRKPEELPPALRSRCTEIFFDDLKEDSIQRIAKNSVMQIGFDCDDNLYKKISIYACSGREAVNMIEMASSVAMLENRKEILEKDLDWVFEIGRYQPLPINKIAQNSQIGVINGLAVTGADRGRLLKIEAWAKMATENHGGSHTITGIVDEEEMKAGHGTIRRKSTAKASVENVMTAIEFLTGISTNDYDIHINFPGGIPVDGPSAGTALFCAVYSALFSKKINNKIAMTGEISLYGDVLPVGGVTMKIEAAKQAGVKTVFIPKENWKDCYNSMGIEVKTVTKVTEILDDICFQTEDVKPSGSESSYHTSEGVLTAESL